MESKQTMALLLRFVFFSFYALPLPTITSTPLEGNPDNLAWDTSFDNMYGSEHESVRKIPKSIFILPNHQNTHGCPPGYTMSDDRKCYKHHNFNLDPLDTLKTQVETFLGNEVYEYDYDYESYDSTESSGPFYVPLGFGVRDETPTTTTETSISTKHDKWMQPILSIAPWAVSNVHERNDDNPAVSKDITNKIKALESTTQRNSFSANNRFFYKRLGTSSNEPDGLTTSTTIQPFTQRNLLEQLKFINKFTEEIGQNYRIRFPKPSSVNIFSNFKGGLFKYPAPVQKRTFVLGCYLC